MVWSIFLGLITISVILNCNGAEVRVEDQNDDAQNDNCGKPLLLTPYIEAGKIKEAQKLARVNPLDSEGAIESYSGYLTVNKSCNSNLFFWFFPLPNFSQNAPVTLWLQGGPGESSLYGLFEEIGPFYLDENSKLQSRNYTWNSLSSLLFIDSPVGTGYSFTDTIECFATNEDDVRNDLYEALLQFFKLFPNLKSNDFYIFGESYAGKYVPAIAYSIHENNPKSEEKINLKGLGIGNGLSDPVNMLGGYSEYLYQLGLVDEIGRYEVHRLEVMTSNFINDGYFGAAFLSWKGLEQVIRFFDGGISQSNYAKMESEICRGKFNRYVNDTATKCAIHVGHRDYTCFNVLVYLGLLFDYTKSVKPWIEILVENYPILFYNGQYEIMAATPMTRNFINKMNWSGRKSLESKLQRPFYDMKNQKVCGYTKGFNNLYLAVVRNAGQKIPVDQPECAYELFQGFLFDRNDLA